MTALRKPEGARERTVLAVPSMRCAGCMSKIERGLAELSAVASARVNLSARVVTVDHDPSIAAHDLEHALATLGNCHWAELAQTRTGWSLAAWNAHA